MSTERAEPPGEDEERGWRDRFEEVFAAARALLATRLAILQEELSAKAVIAARGLAFVVAAAALGVGALLLGAALLAALFAKLFNNTVLGILAAVVVYGAGAAGAAWLGVTTLMRVRPFEFPAAAEEISRDLEAVAAAVAPETGAEDDGFEAGVDEKAVADLENRLRAGTE
ncbi:MAG TPA: phage holin family protein [Thermoanaerobaculia bacterium]|jgi:hypothetical protein|nr:phage holin family protein [Thermoanaerobaculia bacterium]